MKRYKITDELMEDFLYMYCEGKGKIWNLFFGRRKVEWNKYIVWVSSDYIVPERIFKLAQELAKQYD